jgi:hypothetical protein
MGVLAGRLMRDGDSRAEGLSILLRSKEGKGNFDVMSYSSGSVNSDPYYNENLVLGDIPEGVYRMIMDNHGAILQTEITIVAGQVNFFEYNPWEGFVFGPPPTPQGGFVPPDGTAAPPTAP